MSESAVTTCEEVEYGNKGGLTYTLFRAAFVPLLLVFFNALADVE